MKYFTVSIMIIFTLLTAVATASPFIPSEINQLSEHEMSELLAQAEQGTAEAQFNLAISYQAQRQFKNALHWYLLAAQQGFTKAQINLALLYQNGYGSEKIHNSKSIGCR